MRLCRRSAWRAPQDFAALQLDEIQDSITVRRNRIFLLMEEVRGRRAQSCGERADEAACAPAQVRRLRIQQRLKTGGTLEEDMSKQEFKSALPLLPPLVRPLAKPSRTPRTPLTHALRTRTARRPRPASRTTTWRSPSW